MNHQVAELLEKAADALESGRIHWGQYVPFGGINHPGAMCASETISVLTEEMPRVQMTPYEDTSYRTDLWGAAAGAVSRHVTKGRDANHLTAWNDAPGRTLDEVVQAFKETAKDIRNQAGAA